MQIGFGIVNVYDIQNNTQVPMVGNIYNLLLLIVFFGVDGHQEIIRIVFRTLEYIPVGQAAFSPNVGLAAMEVFARSFTLGVTIALPMVASGLIIEICMGVLIRTVPQLNMFVVGMPTKLLIGLVLLMITFPAFVTLSGTIFSNMMDGVETMFDTFLTG
jgi:flagellar biosynthetic protein FliR